VVTTPDVVGAGVDVHVVMPDVPVNVHETVPIGAGTDAIPVTVAVNVSVELSDPPPVPTKLIDGLAWATATVVVGVVGNAV